MKKYLILGSSGQIGSHLVEFLATRGNTVLTMDIAENNDEDLRINNNDKLNKFARECDFVFFLAFDVGGAKYLSKHQDTFTFIQNNIKIMSNTFDVLRETKKPFIFVSSQMSDMNHSTYGLCKAIGERYASSLGGLSVRLWNVYGHEEDYEKSHVITDFILKAKNNNKINMLTDGEEERQLLHVDDCCRAMHILSDKYDSVEKQINYHITSFQWSKIIDVANMVASNFVDVQVSKSPTKDMTHGGWRKDPPTDILEYWSPKISLEWGIKDIIQRMR
tara:strand:+ start:4480 stop:5307 length:828 start_codon:yes stop_codon:yes gene_type:complete